jgi:probable rRNA maturation factor
MIEVELLGAGLAPQAPGPHEVRRLCAEASARRGVDSGHVAIEFVDAARIAELNERYRGKQGPTDVLSFPIDGVRSAAGIGLPEQAPASPLSASPAEPPRELGDVVICPEHTTDLREAIVHGMLHLLGMDHEVDDGEMLALQHELLVGGGR